LSVTCSRSVVFSGYTGFPYQWNWPSRYNWNIVESGVKHNDPNPLIYILRIVILPQRVYYSWQIITVTKKIVQWLYKFRCVKFYFSSFVNYVAIETCMKENPFFITPLIFIFQNFVRVIWLNESFHLYCHNVNPFDHATFICLFYQRL